MIENANYSNKVDQWLPGEEEWGEEGWGDYQGARETFWGDGYVHYCDCGNHFLQVKIYPIVYFRHVQDSMPIMLQQTIL